MPLDLLIYVLLLLNTFEKYIFLIQMMENLMQTIMGKKRVDIGPVTTVEISVIKTAHTVNIGSMM